MTAYWTRPELKDEWKTLEQAQEDLQEEFVQYHADNGADYGDRYEDDVQVILYDFERDKILKEETVTVVAEFERSDFDEHNTMWGL